MPLSVSAVRLLHADSSKPSVGSQYLWVVTLNGVPNQWSTSSASPYSMGLFIVSANTGQVLEQVMFTERTNRIGSGL